MSNEETRRLDWTLDGLVARAPGVRHVLVLSQDGLKVSFTAGLDEDRADRLAAVASGVQSLAVSASAEFGEGIGSGQSMVEFRGGVLLIVPAGEGAHLAVVAGADADVGQVGRAMNELVERVGGRLTAPPRRRDGARPA